MAASALVGTWSELLADHVEDGVLRLSSIVVQAGRAG